MIQGESLTLTAEAVKNALQRWITASEHASGLAVDLFRPGDGYGDPNALEVARQQVQAARHDADCLFRDYTLIAEQFRESESNRQHRSQQKLTWASFILAAVVGVSTVVDIVFRLLSKGQ